MPTRVATTLGNAKPGDTSGSFKFDVGFFLNIGTNRKQIIHAFDLHAMSGEEEKCDPTSINFAAKSADAFFKFALAKIAIFHHFKARFA